MLTLSKSIAVKTKRPLLSREFGVRSRESETVLLIKTSALI